MRPEFKGGDPGSGSPWACAMFAQCQVLPEKPRLLAECAVALAQ